jgi:PleD family two-component response regulator
VKERKTLNILLINDDEDDSFILDEVSQYFKEQIILSNTIPEPNLVDRLKTETLPDLIILDLYMSNINGLELLKQIRAPKGLKDVPVIIYSSKQQSFIVKKCFEMGATLFVEKPHTYKGVERMLKKIVAIDWNKHKTKSKEHSFILETDDY